MTDQPDKPTVKPVGNGNLKPFKPGYDPRRWLNGRGKKSPEQREGEQILRAVIWEELSREFDRATMAPLEDEKTVDALRLMVRTWIKKRPEEIAERIAGKVTDKVEHTGKDGEPLIPLLSDEDRLARMKQLAAAIAEEVKKNA